MKHTLSIFAAFAALTACAITTTLEYEDARETLTRAAVSNDLAQAVTSATNTLAQALADGSIEVRAASARFADEAGVAGMAYSANGLYGENSERTADEIFTSIDASASTNDVMLTPMCGGNGKRFSEWALEPELSDVSVMWATSPWAGSVGWFLWSDADENFLSISAKGNEYSTNLSWTRGEDETDYDVTATRTENPIIGYTLGSQTGKPLQPQGDYAPATNIAKSALASDVQASLGKADTALQTAPVTSVNNKTGAVSLSASDVGAVPTAGGTMTGQLTVPMLAVGRFYQVITATEDLDGAYVEICGRWFFENFSGSRITCRDGMETKSVAFLSDIPSIAGLAPLASPAFTGTPTAPTPASGDNSTKVATTAFVKTAISGISVTPLSGQTFNFATTQGVMDALKTVIETLGGTVTNAPSTTISQGE